MQPTVLQFATLAELASYARKVSDKGFQINTLNLTLKSKLTDAEVKLARQQFKARKVDKFYV